MLNCLKWVAFRNICTCMIYLIHAYGKLKPIFTFIQGNKRRYQHCMSEAGLLLNTCVGDREFGIQTSSFISNFLFLKIFILWTSECSALPSLPKSSLQSLQEHTVKLWASHCLPALFPSVLLFALGTEQHRPP